MFGGCCFAAMGGASWCGSSGLTGVIVAVVGVSGIHSGAWLVEGVEVLVDSAHLPYGAY